MAFDPGGLRPFTTLRWPVLAGTVLVAAAVAAGTGRPQRVALPRGLRAGAAAFLGWMALAAVLAVDPASAWLGHPQRHLGLLAWVVCLAAFGVGLTLGGRGARRVLGRAVVVACGVLGAAVLVELAGVRPAGVVFDGGRVGGLFGQPSYLGAAGVLLVPAALGAAAGEARWWRWAGRVAAASGACAVIASQTRGAWAGLAVATAVAWPAWRPARGVVGRRWVGRGGGRSGPAVAGWVAAVIAAAGVVGLVAVLTPLGGRALATFDLDGGSARGRLDEWRLAAAVVVDHPLVGVGPEGYRVAATAHIDDTYTQRYGRDVVVDRAHNGLLDVAVAGGLPAVALYAGLVAMVARRLWVARRHPSPFVAGAAAAVLGYLAQQVFLFPLAEVDPLAWLLAGCVVAATGQGSPAVGPDEDTRRAWQPPRWAVRWVAAVGCGALAVAVVVAGARDVAADHHLRRAGEELARGRPAVALAEADAASSLRPDSLDAWHVAAEVAAAGPSLVDLDLALDRVAAGRTRSAGDPALADLEEGLLVARALRSGLAADQERAVAAVTGRLAADAAHPVHHRRLGLLREAAGDRAGAVAALDRALVLDSGDDVTAAARRRLAGVQP